MAEARRDIRFGDLVQLSFRVGIDVTDDNNLESEAATDLNGPPLMTTVCRSQFISIQRGCGGPATACGSAQDGASGNTA